VRLANTSSSKSGSAQVTSVGTDGSTATVIMHKDVAELVFSFSSATLPITTCNLMAFGTPSFSLLSEDGNSNRKNSIGQRIGLINDLHDIEDFTELQGSWNVEHPPSLLLKIDAVGASCITQPSSIVKANKKITACLARIMIRSNGVVHVNSMGPQELVFARDNVDRLQVELLNNDGSPYESHRLDHNISLIITYSQ